MFCAEAMLLVAVVLLHYLVCPIHSHLCKQKFVKPENYSALDLPSRPIVVNVDMKLKNLVDIDETRKQFHAKLWLNIWWTDQRLKGDYPLKENCSLMLVKLNKENLNDIWLPEIGFARTSYNIYDNFDKAPFNIAMNGNVSTNMSVSAIFDCLMDFKRYPHDDFNCTIRIVSTLLRTDDLILKSTLKVGGGFYNKRNKSLGNSQFELDVMGIEDYDKRMFSSSVITIRMSRITTHYLISTYAPSAILVFASKISFSIPPENIPGRMALLVTILLMLINMFGDVRDDTPLKSAISYLDVWFMVWIVFVTGVLFEYAAIIRIRFMSTDSEATVKARCRKLDIKAELGFTALYLAFIVTYFLLAYL